MAKVVLNDVANLITTSIINTNNATLEAAFDNTLSRDGTAPNAMLAPIDMNSNTIINVADGVNPQDVATVAQVSAVVAAGLPSQTGHAAQFLQTDGSIASWQVPAASEISNIPAGNITAIDVQAAINELDTEKADGAATTAALALKADDAAVVHLTGAESVAGVKTFSSAPIVPTPTAATEAANKQYVDDMAIAMAIALGG